jgi:cytochrome P450
MTDLPLDTRAPRPIRGDEVERYDTVDYFSDPELIRNPYPYYDYLRSKCPVLPNAAAGVVSITGHEEALSAYKDPAFSAANSVVGPFAPLPFEAEGDDIADLLEQFRGDIPMAEHVSCMDPPAHTRTRGLLSRLITPKRLNENEDFIATLVDQMLDSFIPAGRCEFLGSYAKPLSLLVIADLLGVPEEDHAEFGGVLSGSIVAGAELPLNPLEWLDEKFTAYISDRRREPRGDVLTELAQAKYEDGATPEVDEVVKLATFLFAAGQETTTKLLSQALRNLGERPDIQEQVRADRSLIPVFLEETLRLESPVKSHFRIARTSTSVGGFPIKAGTTIMLLPGAANRDPRKFESPDEFRLDRRNVREHVAFARGVHSCPGAPLARTEARISLNRILDRTADIRISEAHHGPAESRRYSYEPTFVMRGLTELHIEFTPIE